MAEILIKGMEMPKECYSCRLVKLNKDGFLDCLLLDKACSMSSRHPDCPLIKVPLHGRLIDAEKLEAIIRNTYCENCQRTKPIMCNKACEYGEILDDIDDVETVIEAST